MRSPERTRSRPSPCIPRGTRRTTAGPCSHTPCRRGTLRSSRTRRCRRTSHRRLVPGRAGSALEPDAGSGTSAQHSRVARRVRATVDIDARERIGASSAYPAGHAPHAADPPLATEHLMSGSHPRFLEARVRRARLAVAHLPGRARAVERVSAGGAASAAYAGGRGSPHTSRSLRSRRRRRPRIRGTRAARRPAGPVVRTCRERVTPAVVRGACALPVHPAPPEPHLAGHGYHDRSPPLAHLVSLSQPPFAVAHSSMSTHVSPSPSYPEGHAPHVRPPTTLST